MKIWRWSYEPDKYDSFTFPDHAEVFKFLDEHFDGNPIGESWSEFRFETYRSRKTCDCTGIGSTLPIFSEQAIKLLEPCLNGNAEILPLQHPTKKYYAINVTRVIEGLDFQKAVLERHEQYTQIIKDITKYAFDLNAVKDYAIFKLPEFKKTRIFVTDHFKNAVEEHGLTGFEFTLLWDSEEDSASMVDTEMRYREALEAIERNKGDEFSFQEALKKIESGEAVASGKWRIQQDHELNIILGELNPDGSYYWIEAIYYPPILLDLKWHLVNKLEK